MYRRPAVISPKISVSNEPKFGRGGQYRPVISTAASHELRELLKTKESVDKLATSTIELQLKTWDAIVQQVTDADITLGKPLGLDLETLPHSGEYVGQKPADDAKAILHASSPDQNNAIWDWGRLPYSIKCSGMAEAASAESDSKTRPAKKTKTASKDPHFVSDVDDWVIKNEEYLRLLSRAEKASLPPQANKPWQFGLVRLEDVPLVVPSSAPVSIQEDGKSVNRAYQITRTPLSSLPGFNILNQKRQDILYMQASDDTFGERWSGLTSNLLQGLNWDNLFVAGGLVLGALLNPNLPKEHKNTHDIEGWSSSDIDMYIFGLDPLSANAKIEHIEEVFRKNLPKDAPYMVVRNSQTVTMYSSYPIRRVQVVLKLVKSPREVLLNFDLDICAAGYDGTSVWMLPRFVRAIETGMNTFTMDLINGHYLGDRKATRDKRVFKYANKGFGFRILPSYLSVLPSYKTEKKLASISRGERLFKETSKLEQIAKDSRAWTETVLDKYLRIGTKNSPFHWPNKYPSVDSDKPVFSHAMLESYAQVSSEPLGRSCLTGFSLFMRHVALWEAEAKGEIKIFEDLYATDTYGECSLQNISYDDSPAYSWDKDFKIELFKKELDKFNEQEISAAIDGVGDSAEDFDAARITYADDVATLFSSEKDIVIPLFMPKGFLDHANQLILAGLAETLPNHDAQNGPLKFFAKADGYYQVKLELDMVLWRLDKVLNWQMLDRRIDEVREVLWAFHRAYERSFIDEEHSSDILKTNLSRRAIRLDVQDEMESFVRWVGRVPYHEDTNLNAMYAYNDDEDLTFSDEDDE